MAAQQNRMSYRLPLVVAGTTFACCALLWLAWGLRLYWNDIKLVNFLAAWIPFVLSLLLAFVPEHKMTPLKKYLWRSGVIAVGFAWSVVLWHQQVVTDIASRRDQQNMVTDAVKQSNQHSDEQIKAVRGDVKDVRTDIGGIQTDLNSTKGSITTSLSKVETVITTGLGKVGKPDPPEPTRLAFTFMPDDPQREPPITTIALAGKDDIYTVPFSFTNTSSTAGASIDIWIAVCRDCGFAEEPAGFDRPPGLDNSIRHRMIALINPGTTMEKQVIKVKTKAHFSQFVVGFWYACGTCDKTIEHQTAFVTDASGD